MRLKNKKGFTLVEMIISLAIISIMMMVMLAFFGPVATMIKEMSQTTHAENAVVDINSYITKSLVTSTEVVVYQGYVYTDIQSKMTEVASALQNPGINFDPAIEELRCLRLVWGPRVGTSRGYMLVEEPLDQNLAALKFTDSSIDYSLNGIPASMDAKKIFNDGYYKDLNFKFSVDEVLVDELQPDGITTIQVVSPYICALSAVPYKDATFKEQYFLEDNTKDYIVFNNMRLNQPGCKIKINTDTTTTTPQDIYIFYRKNK